MTKLSMLAVSTFVSVQSISATAEVVVEGHSNPILDVPPVQQAVDLKSPVKPAHGLIAFTRASL